MADINYYVDDYIEQGYYVYTADAVIGLGDYLVEDYLTDDYFQRTGVYATLTAELVRATYIQGEAAFTAAFTQTTTFNRFRDFNVTLVTESSMSTSVIRIAGFATALTASCSIDVSAEVDRRTSVTLSTLANINAQADRFARITSDLTTTATQSTSAQKITDTGSALSAEFTQTTQALRTAPAAADLTSSTSLTAAVVKTARAQTAFDSIASQLTAAFKNATGTILMEPQASLSVIIGVIKQFEHNTITGVSAPEIAITSPAINTTWTNLVVSVWTNRENVDATGQAPIWSTPIVTSAGGLPAYILRLEYNNTSQIRLVRVDTGTPIYWTWSSAFPNDNDWHNIVLVYRGPGTSNYKKFELFVDGQSKGIAQQYYSGDQSFWTSNLDEGDAPGLRLGRTVYGNGESDKGNTEYAGNFAQLWIGKDSTFNIVDFYDQGIVDLGSDGTSYGRLPTPLYYNELDSLANTYYQIPATTPLSRPDLIGRFSLAAESVSVLENTAYLSAVASVSATATRIQTATSNLTATATVSCAAAKTVVVESNQTSSTALSIDYIRYRDSGAALSSQSTQVTDNLRVRYFDTGLSSTATLTAAVAETTELAADLTATATFSIDYTRIRFAVSSQTSQASLAFDPEDRLRDQSADLTAQATLSCDGINLEGTRVQLSCQSTLVCNAEKRIIMQGNLSAAFTISADVIKVVNGTSTFSALAATLTIADIINFDPFLTIVVPPETRTIRVLSDSTLFVVPQETRIIKVRSETRVLEIPEDTKTKLIQGYPE